MESLHTKSAPTALMAVAVLAFPAAGAASAPRKDYGINAATGDTVLPPSRDLRSPDAAGATTPATGSQPRVQVVKVSDSGGFDWGDAGVGAGGALGLMLLAAGGTLAATRRRGTAVSGSPSSPAAG
jgi:hypothetical protein